MTITEKDQIYSKSEAAEFLAVSPRTLDRMIARRDIDYFRVGVGRGRVRFTKRALLDALNRGAEPADRNARKPKR